MASSKLRLGNDEIASAFRGDMAVKYPPVLNTSQVAELLNQSPKTISEWRARGRLDGTFRRRGKHCIYWRDRIIDKIFNGVEWTP